jgi:hypothetical protein
VRALAVTQCLEQDLRTWFKLHPQQPCAASESDLQIPKPQSQATIESMQILRRRSHDPIKDFIREPDCRVIWMCRSKNRRVDKSLGFGLSVHSRNDGATNYWRSESDPPLFIFYRVEALPLVFTRFLRPQWKCGDDAESPRKQARLWSRHRPFHDPAVALHRPLTRIIRSHGPSLSLPGPWQEPCQRSIHIHGQAMASPVRNQAVATDAASPRAGRGRELSATRIWPQARNFHRPGLSTNSPTRRITVSVLSPVSIPVRTRTTLTYVLI